MKGCVEKHFPFCRGFLKLISSHIKKKSKLVELEVPHLLLFPSEPFSKPTSLKMTFIDFHSMSVILQNEDGGVRERNLPCVTCGIGVPSDLSDFICSVSCIQKPAHWGSLGPLCLGRSLSTVY